MDMISILKKAAEQNASDIFIVSGAQLCCKSLGKLIKLGDTPLMRDDAEHLVHQLFVLAGMEVDIKSLPPRELDFSISVAGIGRFRANVYKQRGSFSAVLRYVPFELPDASELGIPEEVMALSDSKNGIILITGVASSGKSTTLSCMINRINHKRTGHIITIEDPIEFLHKHEKCIVSQREIDIDTESYLDALRAALRQSPDVILLGEMRDYETISVAMTAAETGQLVLSTLHTLGAANTIDRIIDVFPINQQHQIRVQLSMVLTAVVSQQLLPAVDGRMIPAFEVMTMNSAIRTLIREEKTHQIDAMMQAAAGMQTMDNAIMSLYKSGEISRDTAINYAYNQEIMRKRLV